MEFVHGRASDGAEGSGSESTGGDSLARRLRTARRNAGLSQSEVERRCGVPKTSLSRYENGRMEPSLSTLRRLSRALEVSEARLISETSSYDLALCDLLRERGLEITSLECAHRIAELIAETCAQDRRAESLPSAPSRVSENPALPV